MRALVLLLVLLCACDTTPPAARPPSVDIVVAGKHMATVDPGQASSVVPLGAVVPGHPWTVLRVTRPGGAEEVIAKAAHAGLEPALYLEGGRVALGFFRPADIARRQAPRARIGVVARVALE